VIALALAALLLSGPVSDFQAPTDPQGPTDPPKAAAPAKKPKSSKNAKDPGSSKKSKKKKKAAADVAAPDEPLADDADVAAQPQIGVVKAPKPATQFVWKQHPSLRFGKWLRLDLEAKFQEDYRSSYDGAVTSAQLDPWELHRSRIGVLGTFMKHIDFEVERELQEKELSEKDKELGLTPAPQWKDVYVNADYIKNAQIQVGKFKVPFGLDTTTGVSHNDFVYRSLGSIYLTPSRDVGGQVHGRFFKRGLNYWTGVFVHDGDNARSKKIQGGDTTFATRVTGLPLRHANADVFGQFEVGGAFATTSVSDDSFRPNGLRSRTVVTQDTFYESVYVKGRRQRYEADLDWTFGPGSMRAEYTHVTDQRKNQSFTDGDLPDARYRSWYVSGTWILTGEHKTRPVKAGDDFLRGGFGAVEVAGRVERIWIDSADKSDEPFANPRAFTILPSDNHAVTMGVNWTLNRFTKLQFNLIREQVGNPDRNPVPDGAAFWSRVFRLQLVL
jgi:phosphate-selective porin OprO/OprP